MPKARKNLVNLNNRTTIAEVARFNENKISTIDRFLDKIFKENGHWIWKNKGSSFRGDNLENTTAPRYSYTYFKGQIPENEKYVMKVTCGIANCVNPDHLILQTLADRNRILCKRWENIHNCQRCGALFEIRCGKRMCIPCYLSHKRAWTEKNNKAYYERTRETHLLKNKEYRLRNKAIIAEKSKIYALKNKDKLRKKSLEWYHKNKNKVKK